MTATHENVCIRKVSPGVGRRRPGGFTLIEILVVIGIIAILLGIVVAVSSQLKVRIATEQTRTTFKNLQAILEMYRTDTGTVPGNTTAGAGDQMAAFITAAKAYPKCNAALNRLDPSIYDQATVNDGFHRGIKYISDTSKPKTPYFQSAGTNGTFDDADDLYSYEP